MKTAKLPAKLVELAKAEVGTCEDPPDSNCGPRVDIYKSATWLDHTKGWAWCAAFICWLVREALIQTGTAQVVGYFERPRTAGAWDVINWSKAQDNTTETKEKPGADIEAGDIVVFTFSHIGLAVKNAKDGFVETVEGNTDAAGSREGGGVYRKTRPVSKVRARIRFTV